MTTFSSGLSASISSYLVLKRALGRQYAAEEWVLTHLDRFLAARRVDLVAETFAAWCLTLQHLASGTRRARMRIARNLCLYRGRSEPELLRPTTGLRRGELTRLTVGDYDPPQRTLAIRESKFHKSRLVPLSADTAREIEHLIQIRGRRRLPTEADSPLLWHRSPDTGGYSGGGLGGAMRALFRRPGIRTATGHLPRTHDFRHYSGLRIIPSRLIKMGGARVGCRIGLGIITDCSGRPGPRRPGGIGPTGSEWGWSWPSPVPSA